MSSVKVTDDTGRSRPVSSDIGRQRAANHMQMICKYAGKNDAVLSAAAFFEIFGAEDTDSDEDAKELCTVIKRRLLIFVIGACKVYGFTRKDWRLFCQYMATSKNR